MAIPDKANVSTMDYISRGLPFISIAETNTGTLDYIYRALPVLGAEESGESEGFPIGQQQLAIVI